MRFIVRSVGLEDWTVMWRRRRSVGGEVKGEVADQADNYL